jgi:hypothetical protein
MAFALERWIRRVAETGFSDFPADPGTNRHRAAELARTNAPNYRNDVTAKPQRGYRVDPLLYNPAESLSNARNSGCRTGLPAIHCAG